LALAAALAGTAVADQAATSKVTTKKVKKVAKKQAKKQVNKLAPGIASEQIAKRAVGGPIHYVSTTVTVPRAPSGGESVKSGSATCPEKTKVIGGGVKIVSNAFTSPIDSYPTATGWAGTAWQANDLFDGTFIVTAICAKVNEVSGEPPAS
jgi:hypothetical protein